MPGEARIIDKTELSHEEYELVVQRLAREPNGVELDIFAALWSERFGRKVSKALLILFPNTGEKVAIGTGEEYAGAVDIGEGLTVVAKIKAYRHLAGVRSSSRAVDGFAGFSTDVFTIGARPIALLDAVHIGHPRDADSRRLLADLVSGLSDYGSALGVPVVDGEAFFAEPYSTCSLNNVVCVGLGENRHLNRAKSSAVGDLLMLVYADENREGTPNAASRNGRSSSDDQGSRLARAADSLSLERRLMEACLELLQTDHIADLRGVGPAGLAGGAVRLAVRGRSGIELDVLKIPRREAGLNPQEVVLSESSWRVLVVVRNGQEEHVKPILDRWGLCSEVVGRTTGDGLVRIKQGEVAVAEIPAQVLAEPPPCVSEAAMPAWLERLQGYRLDHLPDITGHQLYPHQMGNWGGVALPSQPANKHLLALLASPNVASQEYVFRWCETHVEDNAAVLPGASAAIVRIKDTTKAIALSVSGNGRFCYLDGFVGGAIAMAEAARNVVCVGAAPVATAVFLNLGGLGRPDTHYQAEQMAQGITEACVQLNIPVISAGVDFCDKASQETAYPTPAVGMVGVIADLNGRCDIAFRDEGDLVVLLGGRRRRRVGSGDDERVEAAALGGSEFLALVHGLVVGRPEIDLDLEMRTQRCCLAAIKEGLIKSAHSCSVGGLAVCLAKSCITGGRGFRDWAFAAEDRSDAALFGEQQSRIVVSLSPGDLPWLLDLAKGENVPVRKLGVVTGDHLVISGYLDLPVSQMEEIWRGALKKELVGS